MKYGRLFHVHGPAMAKAWSLKCNIAGTTRQLRMLTADDSMKLHQQHRVGIMLPYCGDSFVLCGCIEYCKWPRYNMAVVRMVSCLFVLLHVVVIDCCLTLLYCAFQPVVALINHLLTYSAVSICDCEYPM